MDAVTGFDLDATEKPFNLVLVKDAEGKATTGLFVRSNNAPELQALEQQLTVKALTKSAQRGRAIDLKQEADAEAWAETVDERNNARAIAAVSGWYGFVKAGQAVACSPELVVELFKKRPAWRDLVLATMDDEANFTQG